MVVEAAQSLTGNGYSLRQFKTLFGVSPNVTAMAWEYMLLSPDTEEKKVVLQDLLKVLHFLKCYSTETHSCQLFNCTEKTFRSKYKPALIILAGIPIICFEKRRTLQNIRHKAKISIDGTDCMIQEQSPFDSKWWSVKFNGPGLRYEVGICILTGHMVWVMGGFPCGRYSDLVIFREGLADLLDEGEVVIADGGYRGDAQIWAKGHDSAASLTEAAVRARHETVNSRLKKFKVLSSKFRHDLTLHPQCFYACANLVQIAMENEEPLFKVEYDEE